MSKGLNTGLEVAVVGMALNFPDAKDQRAFWKNLQDGKESVRFYSDEELAEAGVDQATINHPDYVPSAGSPIEGKENFDASFFGYTPDEAILMNPQTRLFHEVVWSALEDSGYAVADYPGRIGLFAGSSDSFYWDALVELSGEGKHIGRFASMQLSSKDFLTTKVSHNLNLKGPSVPVQTACSTSLVAVHMAARSLLLGECEMAVAGGVTVTPASDTGYTYQEGMILSKDGHCRTFDANSSGTVGGNGAGVVVLKTLKKALASNDQIYAVIKGSAINNDGNRKTAFTAPSIRGQAEVIRSAINFSRIKPESVAYVECHGTATELGDPIETEALKQAYGNTGCALGSVKSNLGHLDSAAGIAGFIKAALCLHHKQLVPSINFNRLNPKIQLDDTGFYVNTTLKDWEASESPRRAGVSSFGIGGTNAHVILEEAPVKPESTKSADKPRLVVTSAKTKASLERLNDRISAFRKEHTVNPRDLAYTLLEGRVDHQYRSFYVHDPAVPTKIPELKNFTAPDQKPSLVFMFPGGGAQYVNMARDLYHQEPQYQQLVKEGLDYLKTFTSTDYLSLLFAEEATPLEDTAHALPLLFITEYALAKLMINKGITPDAMIGHSLGEYVAACISGVFSYQDALKLVYTRGKLMKEVAEGAMISVSASADRINDLAEKVEGVSLAAINSPQNCVFSGNKLAVENFATLLEEQGIEAKIIRIAVASHSALMDPILDEFGKVAEEVTYHKPQIPYVANYTGALAGPDEVNAAYWVNHLRNTVRFAEGIEKLEERFENCVFVEVGPGNILSNLIKHYQFDVKKVRSVNLMRHPKEQFDDNFYLLDKIGELWLYGYPIKWEALTGEQEAQRISLPTYSFEPTRYWIDKELDDFADGKANELAKSKELTDWFYQPAWVREPNRKGYETVSLDRCVLLSDGSGFATGLEDALKQHHVEVATAVVDTKRLLSGDEGVFQEALSQACPEESSHCRLVWIVPDVLKEHAGLASWYQTGFEAAVGLVKSLTAQYPFAQADLTIVSRNVQNVTGLEDIDYLSSTILSPITVMQQEFPNVKSGHLDIIRSEEDHSTTIARVMQEILAPSGHFVAVRGGKSWTRQFRKLSIAEEQPAVMRPGATYFITGGLGRIGFTVLHKIAGKYSPTLYITGSTPIAEREKWEDWLKSHDKDHPVSQRINKIKMLEAQGAQVHYVCADIADRQQTRELVQQIVATEGRLDGVIHSAAVTGLDSFQTINSLGKREIEGHFRTKIEGALALAHALEGIDYDFCLMMSSVSATLGGLGFAPYAAANSFLDHLATKNSEAGLNWISIQWDGWEYLEDELNGIGSPNDGFIKMTTTEGPAALEMILNQQIGGTVVNSLNSLDARTRKWIEEVNSIEETEDHADEARYDRPDILTAYAAPSTPLEEELAELWQGFFKYDKIGINDNFFELGGNSLKGVALISRIHKQFDVQVSVKEFFLKGSIRQLAELMEHAGKQTYQEIQPAPESEYYPLSSAQKRLYLVQESLGQSLSYNESYLFEIHGDIHAERLEAAIQQVISTHEVYRTMITDVAGEPAQKILDEVSFKLDTFTVKKEVADEQIKAYIRPFDFAEPPYLRIALIAVGPQENVLVMDLHHIITDGISANLFMAEIASNYAGGQSSVPAIQYKDYAVWQRDFSNSEAYQEQKQYWLDEFAGEIPLVNLPLDAPRPKVRSNDGDIFHFTLDRTVKDKLNQLAQHENVSVYTILLSAYNILLSKLSNQEDVIIGTPTSGRTKMVQEDMPGMFVNTLVLRNTVDLERSFKEMIQRVNQKTLETFEHQDYQYEQLVDDLKLIREPSRNPLFDVVFTFQNMESEEITFNDITIKPYAYENKTTKFDLILAITESEEEFICSFNYATALFTAETIGQFQQYFSRIIDYALHNADKALSEMELLSQEEQRSLLSMLNGLEATYLETATIHEVFEAQVANFPQRVAVTYQEQSLTYEELDLKASFIASQILAKGLEPGTIVGLYSERNLEVVIGILAILKAGCTYLPLDIHYPAERIHYILTDSKSQLVLTTTSYADQLSGDFNQLLLDQDIDLKVAGTVDRKGKKVSSDAVAYIIYTSGTTGKPKGVMVTHSNVIRLLINSQFQFDFSENDVWTMFHSHGFDFSVWEMYGALFFGGKLVIVPQLVARDSGAMCQLLNEHSVTVLNQTPTAFYQISNELLSSQTPHSLRYVIFGGEALVPKRLASWYEEHSDVKLVNMYGITETTVHVTYKEIGASEIAGEASNIGKPIPTLTAYVMDKFGKLQPQGVAGELCVGGAGVAKGYLFRPALTAEKFISNPYNPAERLYKSGDLVRALQNGDLEYLGRIDQQVKIRGYRIEIKEIESHIVAHHMVTETVVLPVKNTSGTDALCAYMVVTADYDQQQLTRNLADSLPDYMVPSYFMTVDEIPVTQNGKVNTRALPAPVHQQEQVVEARNETEKTLVAIWKDTLKIDNIGITNNFFHVGGDSINAIKLINNVKESFGIEVRVADLYVNETIEKFSEHLNGLGETDGEDERTQQILQQFESLKDRVLATHPDKERIEDVYPMTEIQRGMVFNYLKNLGTGVYHDQFLFNLSYKEFDQERFTKALELLVAKHEMLRVSFDIDNYEEFIQIIYRQTDLPLETETFEGMSMEACRNQIKADLIEDIARPFDKDVRSLWRMKLYQLNDADFTLMLSFHHAILDGWSVASLTTELNNIYVALSDHPDFEPAKLRSSYKDAVISEIYEKEATEKLDFWRSELSGYERLEMSFLSSHEKTGDMLIYKRALESHLMEHIQQLAVASNSSVKNIMLAAYLCTLKYFSGNRDMTVGLVTNNRPIKEDSDQILGCFLNTIPMRVQVEGEATFSDLLGQIDDKVRTLKAYENVPLFEIANAIGEVSKDKNPIFDTLFNFVNFHIYNDAVSNGEQSDHTREQFSDGNQNTNTLFDFEVSATNNELTLLPKYDPVLISEEFVDRFCDYYLSVLDHLIHKTDSPINTSEVMPEEERQQILVDFNNNTSPYEGELLMHQLFERAVATYPQHIAIDYKGDKLTYQELNQRANQLAHSLKENGVGNGDMIGLIISRKLEMIISMLAIHKAGGAYVPLEPNLPSTRISHILENLSVETVVSDSSLTAKVAEVITDQLATVYFTDVSELSDKPAQFDQLKVVTGAEMTSQALNNPECTATSDQLAYIIFTSGSTGTPKGVMVKHKPVINIVEWVNKTFAVSPTDKLLFITSMGFDLSVYDVFGTLATGAAIRLMDYEEMSNPKHMLDVIIDEQITIWDSAPAAIQVLVPLFEHIEAKRAQSALRLIMLSGDWIPVAMPDQLRATFDGVEVLSLGGATEATIWSNYYRIGTVDEQWKSIPYGKPIQNSNYYILDQDLAVCPVGVPGDLYIGGECLSSGYVNDEQLTASKFIDNPHNPGEIIYKTGDMSRWFPDGNMEFLGRKDGQVKIRGFRIETGEIETILSKHEQVRGAIVIPHANARGEKYLCAYLVPLEEGTDLDTEKVAAFLAEYVPEYMVPDFFVTIPEIPLTPNGKVNRKMLKEPEMTTAAEYVEPDNHVEATLVTLWLDVLAKNDPVSTTSDFFEIGGHSLNVTVLISMIQKKFDVEVSIRDIFMHTTIKAQAELLTAMAPHLLSAGSEAEERENLVI